MSDSIIIKDYTRRPDIVKAAYYDGTANSKRAINGIAIYKGVLGDSRGKDGRTHYLCCDENNTHFVSFYEDATTETVDAFIQTMKPATERLIEIRNRNLKSFEIGDPIQNTEIYTAAYGIFAGFNGNIKSIDDDICIIEFGESSEDMTVNKCWIEHRLE